MREFQPQEEPEEHNEGNEAPETEAKIFSLKIKDFLQRNLGGVPELSENQKPQKRTLREFIRSVDDALGEDSSFCYPYTSPFFDIKAVSERHYAESPWEESDCLGFIEVERARSGLRPLGYIQLGFIELTYEEPQRYHHVLGQYRYQKNEVIKMSQSYCYRAEHGGQDARIAEECPVSSQEIEELAALLRAIRVEE